MKFTTGAFAAGLVLVPLAAQADLTITNKPTKNVSCADGTCTATAKMAALNATDLANMLATTDVSLIGFKGQDVVVGKIAQWAGTHHLSMSSSRNVRVYAPLVAMGTSGLAITYNTSRKGGTLSFGPKGRIELWDTASTLAINGVSYTPVADLATLAADVASNASGNYALANDYDASADGRYSSAPIGASFFGRFEGLGNTISKLAIRGRHPGASLALFGDDRGSVSDLRMTHVSITGQESSSVGGIAADLDGTISGSSVAGNLSAGANSTVGGLVGQMLGGTVQSSQSTGTVTGNDSDSTTASMAGGLIGQIISASDVTTSFSTAKVTGGTGWRIGGLIGSNVGDVEDCYATGTVLVGDNGFAGGLIGENSGTLVANSYATGFVDGTTGTTVGGFIGHNSAAVQTSYSSGAVASGSGNAVGGFIGTDSGPSDLTNTYFDVETSGQSHGVGNNTGYPGVTALTTAQFMAGLPTGFDPLVWAESPVINSGLPYLLALLPI